MATSLESGARSIWKRATRKRSTQRHYYAQVLTVHPVSCTCDLAQNIIIELWSLDEMRAISSMDSHEAGYWVFSEMASISIYQPTQNQFHKRLLFDEHFVL
jgi:hypothetical protein